MKQWTGYDRDDVVAMLRAKVAAKGTQVALAREIGISPAWMSDILLGARAPANRVLAYLGLERQALKIYVPAKKALTTTRGRV